MLRTSSEFGIIARFMLFIRLAFSLALLLGSIAYPRTALAYMDPCEALGVGCDDGDFSSSSSSSSSFSASSAASSSPAFQAVNNGQESGGRRLPVVPIYVPPPPPPPPVIEEPLPLLLEIPTYIQQPMPVQAPPVLPMRKSPPLPPSGTDTTIAVLLAGLAIGVASFRQKWSSLSRKRG